MLRAAWRPCCIATGETPGNGFNSMRKIGEVTNDLHFRMSRNSEVGVYNNPANAVNRYAKGFPDE